KERLSVTFTGAACRAAGSGGPAGLGAAGVVRAAGVAGGTAALQVVLNTPAHSCPAAFLAAATCVSIAPFDDWPMAGGVSYPSASAAASGPPAGKAVLGGLPRGAPHKNERPQKTQCAPRF